MTNKEYVDALSIYVFGHLETNGHKDKKYINVDLF